MKLQDIDMLHMDHIAHQFGIKAKGDCNNESTRKTIC